MQSRSAYTRSVAWQVVLRLTATLGLGAAFASRAPAGELRDVLPGLRVSGPLPVSLQHEVDAAIDRGRTWLGARQNPDGSWGDGSNRVHLTSAAWLALAPAATAGATPASSRAWSWLASQTNAAPGVWLRLARAVHGDVQAPEEAERAIREIRETWRTASEGPFPSEELPQLWLDVWFLNRNPDTATVTGARPPPPADWRARAARVIVNTQLTAPETPGSGFWRASAHADDTGWQSDPVLCTSIALIALQEL
jgi:hypothetical protein